MNNLSSTKELLCLADRNNRHYRRALNIEIEVDRNMKREPQWPPSIDLHPIINRWRNLETAGVDSDSEFGWYQLFLSRIPSADIGLSLGTGTGRHELFLKQQGFVKEWKTINLTTPKGIVLASAKKEKNYSDLNFITLEPGSFKVIFCHGLLHHIINLEHLLNEIYKSLTPDGIFICMEYVGEKKWQWQDSKLTYLNQRLYERYGQQYPDIAVRRPDLKWFNANRPLESIRSDEIPGLLKKFFIPQVEFLRNHLVAPAIQRASTHAKFINDCLNDHQMLEDYLFFLFSLEKEYLQNKISLLPCELIGVYSKRPQMDELIIQLWDQKTIRRELYSPIRWKKDLKHRIKRFIGF